MPNQRMHRETHTYYRIAKNNVHTEYVCLRCLRTLALARYFRSRTYTKQGQELSSLVSIARQSGLGSRGLTLLQSPLYILLCVAPEPCVAPTRQPPACLPYIDMFQFNSTDETESVTAIEKQPRGPPFPPKTKQKQRVATQSQPTRLAF